MTWSKLSDDYLDRPTFAGVSRSARLLDVEALVWSNKHLTDGVVPKRMIRRIAWDSDDADADAQELVASGAWTDAGDAYQLDWQHQVEKAEWKKKQDENARRQERFRRHKAGNHAWCTPSFCTDWRAKGITYEPRYLDTLTAEERDALPSEGEGDVTRYVTRDQRVSNVLPIPNPNPSPSRAEGKRDGDVVKRDAGGAARAPASAGATARGGHAAAKKKNPRGGPRGFHRCGSEDTATGHPCGTAVGREGELCPHHRPEGRTETVDAFTDRLQRAREDKQQRARVDTTMTHAAPPVPQVPAAPGHVPPQPWQLPEHLRDGDRPVGVPQELPEDMAEEWRAKAHPYGSDVEEPGYRDLCFRCGLVPSHLLHHARASDGGWGSEWNAWQDEYDKRGEVLDERGEAMPDFTTVSTMWSVRS